ncbi:cyclic lactone autoinducer peptide [Pseudobutyrivibrio ruminis]|jgi:cyclic lactone autoinducer peptide|nr:cyclic lactone autoinducer peptide [Pseudobutyrivibrio ruminis]
MNMKKDVVANVLEKVARATAKATADTRCVYFHHQPKMPTDLKKLSK